MKIRYLLALLLVALAGCVHPFWNPAGARAIRHTEFDTLYYQLNEERTKAYVFFSDHPLLIIGMSLSTKWDKEAEKFSISFGGVKKTKKNLEKWGDSQVADHRIGDLWVKELDIYVGVHGDPDDEFQLHYVTRRGVWEHKLPFKGTIDKELQNQLLHGTAGSRADAAPSVP